MTFSFKNVLGINYKCLVSHCVRAPSLFVAVLPFKRKEYFYTVM